MSDGLTTAQGLKQDNIPVLKSSCRTARNANDLLTLWIYSNNILNKALSLNFFEQLDPRTLCL